LAAAAVECALADMKRSAIAPHMRGEQLNKRMIATPSHSNPTWTVTYVNIGGKNIIINLCNFGRKSLQICPTSVTFSNKRQKNVTSKRDAPENGFSL
jgi:hypothetical protein